jgi:hypothetical protein
MTRTEHFFELTPEDQPFVMVALFGIANWLREANALNWRLVINALV